MQQNKRSADLKDVDQQFKEGLAWKTSGGVPLEVFVSDAMWMGGMVESMPHEPFVAIGPEEWESEQELSFLKSREAVEALIAKLQEAADKAFD